jgi:hypothetical protein
MNTQPTTASIPPVRIDDQPPVLKSRIFNPCSKPEPSFHPVALPEPPHPAALDDAAYYGLVGDIVRTIAPHTEADPAALLLQLLVAIGNCIGRGPHFTVEMTPHYTNEFCVIVGQSAKARKGTSFKWIVTLLDMADPGWRGKCQAHGLVSGEGIIHHVRDEMPGGKEGEVVAGITDKRLLIVEEEFGAVLAAATRKENTLTSILRCAWDGIDLRTLAKNSHEIATAPHISVIGHITLDELKNKLRGDSITNGFANRFLWIYARRSQMLPHGGTLCAADLRGHAETLQEIIETARGIGELRRDSAADDLWCAQYEQLSAERSGMLGAVTSRQEAHAVRLSHLYALLDGSRFIRVEHLRAALAICDYALRSADYCFGGLSPNAKAILNALQFSAPEGLSRTFLQKQVFQGHCDAVDLEEALRELEAGHYATTTLEKTAGPTRELWHAANYANLAN